MIAQSQKQNVVNSKAISCALSLPEGEGPAANKQWFLLSLPRNSYDSLFCLPIIYFVFSLMLCTCSFFSFLCSEMDYTCSQGSILFQWPFGCSFMPLMPLLTSWVCVPIATDINHCLLQWSCKDLGTYLAFPSYLNIVCSYDHIIQNIWACWFSCISN